LYLVLLEVLVKLWAILSIEVGIGISIANTFSRSIYRYWY